MSNIGLVRKLTQKTQRGNNLNFELYDLASWPGLLAPAFVSCSTNAGGGLVKLSHVQWCAWMLGGRVKEWHIPRQTAGKWVHYDCKHEPWNDWVLDIRQSWWCFLGSESCFIAIQKECATPLHVHPTSKYVIACDQFYQAFPCVGTTSDKRWGEKVWVRG